MNIKRDTPYEHDHRYEQLKQPDTNNGSGSLTEFSYFLQQYQGIRNQSMHSKLKEDLIENQWKLPERRVRHRAAIELGSMSDTSNDWDF